MKISIVSGTFNRLPLLKNMMTSVREQVNCGIDLEFVLVDGGSTDGTLEWAKAQDDVVLIEHGELLGAIQAFCDGANAATGKYVILANDDVTFEPGSILTALRHLEDQLECGAVAFADDRSATGKQGFRVEVMGAQRAGRGTAVYYAQVGMFRKWLGDQVGWWGVDDVLFPARTYAGDNYLSARIWEEGYSVDKIEGVNVKDMVYQDDLRLINGGNPDKEGNHNHKDTEAYNERFAGGVRVSETPQIEQQDKTQLRVLYLPIYEPGHAIQKEQKRGLREALMNRGAWVQEVDYLAVPAKERVGVMIDYMETFMPHLCLTQLHGADIFSPDDIRMIRSFQPRMVWVNWNGDVYPNTLTSEPMMAMLRRIDLQCTVNASVLETYRDNYVNAAYWQIGYEKGDPKKARKELVGKYDVVFLGSAYDERRKQLQQVIEAVDCTCAFYGDGWDNSRGNTLYDFDTGDAIIQKAKMVIGDNMYPNDRGFVSNRIFQSLAAGGAMLLHQIVPGLEELTGLINTEHYIAWETFEDLQRLIPYYLEHETERKKIAKVGTRYTRTHHSFDARLNELFTKLLPGAGMMPRKAAAVRFIGKRRTNTHKPSFSVSMPDGKKYQVDLRKSDVIHIDPLHLKIFLNPQDGNWVQTETARSMELVR